MWVQLFGYHLHPSIPVDASSTVRIVDVGTGTGYVSSSSHHVSILFEKGSSKASLQSWVEGGGDAI